VPRPPRPEQDRMSILRPRMGKAYASDAVAAADVVGITKLTSPWIRHPRRAPCEPSVTATTGDLRDR
jgi:hypothetical protein